MSDQHPPILSYSTVRDRSIFQKNILLIFVKWLTSTLDGQLVLLGTTTLLYPFEWVMNHFHCDFRIYKWLNLFSRGLSEPAEYYLIAYAMVFWPIVIFYHFILRPPRGRDSRELVKPAGIYLFLVMTLYLYWYANLHARTYGGFAGNHFILILSTWLNLIAYFILAWKLICSLGFVKMLFVLFVLLIMMSDSIRVQNCPHAFNMMFYGIIFDLRGHDCGNLHVFHHWWDSDWW